MSDDVRFALIPRIDPVTKPVIFDDADQLARSIQRRRRLRKIEMVEHEDLPFEGRAGATRVVEVWALGMANDREERIGYAWLNGRGLEALRYALIRNPAVPTAEAAS